MTFGLRGVQPRYNLLFRQVERELFPLCAEEGLGVIPYNPIAGGLLSGKHRRETGPMPGTRFTHPTAGARYRERYWHERELETVEALRPLAAVDKGLDAGLKAQLDELTREYRWGDDIR
jgi:aryl-alcohol dehydrogenase-like predicted oxidoreductase